MSVLCSVVSWGHAAKHGCTLYDACISATVVACIMYRLVTRLISICKKYDTGLTKYNKYDTGLTKYNIDFIFL